MQPARFKPADIPSAPPEETTSVRPSKPGSSRITIAEATIGSTSSNGDDKKGKKNRKSVKGFRTETTTKMEVVKSPVLSAKPRPENDTSSRSSSSGSKSDSTPGFDVSLHDPLADYSEEYLAKLEPGAQSALLKYCQERIDIDQNAKTICERIKKIQGNRLNRSLLDAIVYNDALRLAICLDNTTLLETDELFTAIKDVFQTEKGHNRKLIAFCMEWIAENRGTKRLVQAQPILAEIVSICQKKITDTTSEEDKKVTSGLAGIVEKGLKPVQKPPFVSPFAAESTCEKTMDEILRQIKALELSSNDVETNFASKVAIDLHGHQALLFLEITPQDFVKKYKEAPESIERCLQFFNAISDYAAETVVNSTALIERLRVMRFLLLVARYSRKLGDFQSLGAICYGICGDITVARLKNTWKSLREKSKEMKELISEMETLASPENFQKNLQEAQSSHPEPMKIIPFLGLIHKTLTYFDDGGMKIVGGEYNFSRALDRRALILKALETQGKVRPQNGIMRPFSNIVFSCLRNFPSTKDGCEAREAARLERSKQLEPPNPIMPKTP